MLRAAGPHLEASGQGEKPDHAQPDSGILAPSVGRRGGSQAGRPFTLQQEEAVWGAWEPHDLPGGLFVLVMTFSLRVSVSPAAAWM